MRRPPGRVAQRVGAQFECGPTQRPQLFGGDRGRNDSPGASTDSPIRPARIAPAGPEIDNLQCG